MKAHSEKFDEKLSKKTRNEACGLPESAGMNKSKVNKGESGSFKEVALDVRHAISDRWMRQIKPVTGCDSYDQLRLRTTQEEHNEKPT